REHGDLVALSFGGQHIRLPDDAEEVKPFGKRGGHGSPAGSEDQVALRRLAEERVFELRRFLCRGASGSRTEYEQCCKSRQRAAAGDGIWHQPLLETETEFVGLGDIVHVAMTKLKQDLRQFV